MVIGSGERKMNSQDPLDNEWDYRDCRLENNGIIPKTSGYNKTFKYQIKLPAHGVNGEYLDWCTQHCKGKFGWHFEPTNEQFNDYEDGVHWNDEQAVLSFSNKKEAFLFSLYIK
tara:strand:+ start:124 stop:465 length:342 start_codon:yes stop_codon:yes gene_type:complete